MAAKPDQAPAQPIAVRQMPSAADHGAGIESCPAGAGRHIRQIDAAHGPVIEPLALEAGDLAIQRAAGLGGIARQDLDIGGIAEGEHAVAGPLPRMRPAEGGGRIRPAREMLLARGEIGGIPDQVIDSHAAVFSWLAAP